MKTYHLYLVVGVAAFISGLASLTAPSLGIFPDVSPFSLLWFGSFCVAYSEASKLREQFKVTTSDSQRKIGLVVTFVAIAAIAASIALRK